MAAKKKSTLQRNKDNPYSSYWRKKADSEISRLFKGKPCIVCGATENTCGHHLISRGHKLVRHDVRNIVPLCPKHHVFSNECAPHSTNALAVCAFVELIKEKLPDTYKFWEENKNKTGRTNYKENYEKLKEIE